VAAPRKQGRRASRRVQQPPHAARKSAPAPTDPARRLRGFREDLSKLRAKSVTGHRGPNALPSGA
jgi:hypothetical protein